MIGLLRKDFFNLKKNFKIFLLMLVFYIIMGIVNGDYTIFSTIITIVAIMLPITAMSFDERSKWDRYALTMPISRSNIVFSKYLLGLIFLVSAFILSMVLNLLDSNISFKENITTNLSAVTMGMIYMSIVFPIMFKFGVEKGRIFIMMAFFIPAAFAFLLPKLGISNLDALVVKKLFYIIFAMGPLSLIVSCLVSLPIYRKKEF